MGFFSWKVMGYSFLIGLLIDYISQEGIIGLIGGFVGSLGVNYLIYILKNKKSKVYKQV